MTNSPKDEANAYKQAEQFVRDGNARVNPNTPEDELDKKLLDVLGIEKHEDDCGCMYTYILGSGTTEWEGTIEAAQIDYMIANIKDFIEKDRTNLITQLEAKKKNEAKAEKDYSEGMIDWQTLQEIYSFNTGIDTAIEILRDE